MNFSIDNLSVPSGIAPDLFTICQHMPTGYTFYFTLLATDVTIGFPLNVWMMVLLTREKRGCATSDVFAFNLAIVEVVIFFYVHMWLVTFILKSATLITVLNYFSGLFWIGRPLFRFCICVERYLAVVHPIVYFKHKALRFRLACVGIIWLISVSIGTLMSMDISFNAITSIFVPVLVVESFCSFSILRALRQPQPGGVEREEMNLMKRRAFITILVIQIMMMINNLPVIFLKMLQLFSFSLYTTCVITPIWFIFAEVGSFVYALLYLFRPGRLPCMTHSRDRRQENQNP